MIWEILGINETKDKEEITRAYREKLSVTNPEDKPEEFMALRKAYEEAMSLADEDNNTNDEFLLKLEDIYFDFKKRIDVNEWVELLKDYDDLNLKYEVRDKLLMFLMSNYRIPHNVWLFLDDFFALLDSKEELYEKYDRNFIDYVVNDGVIFKDHLDYNLFDPGIDGKLIDENIRGYYSLKNRPYEENLETIDELLSSSETHPVITGLIYYILGDKKDPAYYEKLYDLTISSGYPAPIVELSAEYLFRNNEFNRCIELADNSKADTNRVLYLKAQSLAGTGEYEEAIKILHTLMDRAHGNQIMLNDLNSKRQEYNVFVIEKYLEKIKEDPDNDDYNLNLAWAYLQNEKFDEALPYVEKISFEKPDAFSYYNIKSMMAYEFDNDEEFLGNIDKLIETIENLNDDGTEETAKRKRRLGEMTSRKAYYLIKRERFLEAVPVFEKAINEAENDGTIRASYTQLLGLLKRNEEAYESSLKIIDIQPNSYVGYFLAGKALFKLRRDREAFDMINTALDYEPSELDSYLIKLRILLRNGADEQAKEIIDLLDRENIVHPELSYCKAIYENYVNKDKDKAVSLYEEAISMIENGNMIEDRDQIYYSYLLLIAEKKDARVKEDRDVLMDICQRGLKHNPDNEDLNEYYGWLLLRDEREDEALELYKKLAEKENHISEVDYQLGSIYYDKDVEEYGELALKYLKMAYDKGHKSTLYKLTFLNYYMDNLDDAERYCLELRKQAVEEDYIDIDSYHRMSYIYQRRRQFTEALKEAEIALENAKRRNIKIDFYVKHIVALLRMSNKHDKAIETVKENREVYGDSYYQTLHDIYVESGRFNDAIALDKEWSKVKGQASKAARDLIVTYVTMDDIKKARSTYLTRVLVMNSDDSSYALNFMNEYENKYKETIKYYENRIKKNDKDDFAYIEIALQYALLGNRQKKIEWANRALDIFNSVTPKYIRQLSLHHIFLTKIYVCQERYEEAREEIRLAKESMCDMCTYCSCKDADTFEVFLLMEEGRLNDALKLANELKEKWPDETTVREFIKIITARLNK